MSEIRAWFAHNCGFVRVRVDAAVARAQGHRNWRVSKNGYVYAAAGRKATVEFLHRLVAGARSGEHVDHINGDLFDARSRNLRRCTPAQNKRNRMHMSPKNTSGMPGVHWYKNRWVAQIGYNNRRIYLGRFSEAAEAVKVRRAAELKYFGAFAPERN